MPQTRSATSNGVVFALIMVGGALATAAAVVLTIIRNHRSIATLEFRMSTTYFLIECFIVGLVVGGMLLFTRPRGPLAPIGAAIAAFVAVEVGVRIGAYLSIIVWHGHFPGTGPLGDLMQPASVRFMLYELLASVVAGGLALVKVLTTASRGTSRPSGPGGPGGPGQPFGHPGQPMPGQPVPGQPMPGQPMPGQPMPGQPMPGQPPYGAPGAPGAPVAGQPPAYGQPPAPGASGWAPGQPIDPPPAPGGPQPGA
ncbi:hypothetical protein [Actinomadura sp. WMMB 499]|uniref:hypothetical protein n=1 Tax=Actinomadura sp. WMMB 499 TaxID=1219491 RepID=UPI001246741D|nr:hypothetical protein [Actinomadura sp. WMMB 499]QFG23015.1 hypothetical protein F7P10_19715 [Actinomadura sp. WMMB 499]